MKKLAFLLWLLPVLGAAQTLQNLPAGFTLRTYPGNPLTLRFTVSGTEAVPSPITAVLRYGKGLIAMPVSQQPSVTTNGREFAVIWGNYPAEAAVHYLEIKLGASVTLGGSIQSDYVVNPAGPSSQSLTISYLNLPTVTLNVTTGGISNATLNQAVGAKADTATTYTRSTINGLVAARLAVAQYNQDMVNLIGAIGLKADASSVYTKTASDGRYRPIGYVPDYSEITGKPTIPTVPSSLSAFDNTSTNFQSGAQVTSSVNSHANRTDNPHGTTAAQVGLGNVNNTTDANKPVSTATQTALNLKQNTVQKVATFNDAKALITPGTPALFRIANNERYGAPTNSTYDGTDWYHSPALLNN